MLTIFTTVFIVYLIICVAVLDRLRRIKNNDIKKFKEHIAIVEKINVTHVNKIVRLDDDRLKSLDRILDLEKYCKRATEFENEYGRLYLLEVLKHTNPTTWTEALYNEVKERYSELNMMDKQVPVFGVEVISSENEKSIKVEWNDALTIQDLIYLYTAYGYLPGKDFVERR